MSLLGQSNWIDPACFFALGVTEAQLKDLLPDGVIMSNGFICSNKELFPPEDLASIFTGIFGLLQKQIDGAPTSQAFFDCLVTSHLCQWHNDRYFCAVTTSSSLTIPLPGTWIVNGDWAASSSSNYRPINIGGFVGGEHDENADIYTGVICEKGVAGGKNYNISTINSQVSDPVSDFWMKIEARRTDCI